MEISPIRKAPALVAEPCFAQIARMTREEKSATHNLFISMGYLMKAALSMAQL